MSGGGKEKQRRAKPQEAPFALRKWEIDSASPAGILVAGRPYSMRPLLRSAFAHGLQPDTARADTVKTKGQATQEDNAGDSTYLTHGRAIRYPLVGGAARQLPSVTPMFSLHSCLLHNRSPMGE